MEQPIETTIAVVIRIPEIISDRIMEVKKATNVYYDNHEASYPHVTLYNCKFDEAKYPELLASLSGIGAERLHLTLSNLIFSEQWKHNNMFVYFDVLEKQSLQVLHEQVVGIANPLRGDLVRNKDLLRFKAGKMTQDEFDFTKKYGMQYYMERYNPHITIGTIEIGDATKTKELKDGLEALEGEKFVIDKMSVFLKKRTIPDQTEVFKSEEVEIDLR